MRIKPDLPQGHSSLGLLLYSSGKSEEAKAAYREALRLDPDCNTARSNLATALQYEGKLDEAIAQFRALAKQLSAHGQDPLQPGNALWQQKKFAQALAEQEEALRLNPHHVDALVNIGCIKCELGQLDEGMASCARR